MISLCASKRTSWRTSPPPVRRGRRPALASGDMGHEAQLIAGAMAADFPQGCP